MNAVRKYTKLFSTLMCAAVLGGLAFGSGCTPAYRPQIVLAESVKRPDRSVVLITVDGMSEPVMDQMLRCDRLPNMARLIRGGVRVHGAIDSLPSITYANLTTILTGTHPQHHGILGNKWFDRYTLRLCDYGTTRTYRDVDYDCMVPTVYEHLGERFSVSIQCAMRRGVGRTIDNWASSGLRWFAGGFEATDQLIPWRFDIIAEEANIRGEWPSLIHAYFPGTDEVGHQCGSNSHRYRESLRNVDRQIGLILETVAQAGMAEHTCFILTADHNHTPVTPCSWFDVAGWLRKQAGLVIRTAPTAGRNPTDRQRVFDRVDGVVVVNGDRIAAIHLRGPAGWHQRPTEDQVHHAIGTGPRALFAQLGVDFIAVPGPDRQQRRVVDIYSNRGRSQIVRQQVDGRYLYSYQVLGRDAVDFAAGADFGVIYDGQPHDRDTWLRATINSDYPGLVCQLADMFDSARAGDLVVFAADGWDFAPGNRGGHGGARVDDTRVPLIFAGPMIDDTAFVESARLVDITPTILGILGATASEEESQFDGRDLSGLLLRSADHVQR